MTPNRYTDHSTQHRPHAAVTIAEIGGHDDPKPPVTIAEIRKKGVVLTISSVAGTRYLGFPHLGYSVTKAAVIQFTKVVAVEQAPAGIRANCIIPGLIDTPRIAKTVASAYSADLAEAKASRDRQVPVGRMGLAWDVAHAAAFLVSDAAAYITGTELVVDGGLTAKFS